MVKCPVCAPPGLWEDFYLGLHAKIWTNFLFITLYYNGFFSLPRDWNLHKAEWFPQHSAWWLANSRFPNDICWMIEWLNRWNNKWFLRATTSKIFCHWCHFSFPQANSYPNHSWFHSTLWVWVSCGCIPWLFSNLSWGVEFGQRSLSSSLDRGPLCSTSS